MCHQYQTENPAFRIFAKSSLGGMCFYWNKLFVGYSGFFTDAYDLFVIGIVKPMIAIVYYPEFNGKLRLVGLPTFLVLRERGYHELHECFWGCLVHFLGCVLTNPFQVFWVIMNFELISVYLASQSDDLWITGIALTGTLLGQVKSLLSMMDLSDFASWGIGCDVLLVKVPNKPGGGILPGSHGIYTFGGCVSFRGINISSNEMTVQQKPKQFSSNRHQGAWQSGL